LKSVTFTKKAKCLIAACTANNSRPIRGVTWLRVGQLSGKETKWPPMVPRFLLKNIADKPIGGLSGKRKFSLWGGMLEGYRHGQEAFCILESLLCSGGQLKGGPPPLQENSQRARYLCAIGQKMASLTCWENVAVVWCLGGGWCDQPWELILSPKSCGQESPKRALQSIFF
jgi:hypothetical protein